MIAHFHVRLQLPDTEPPVYRDVILPDSILLGDINLVISVCFGWPVTEAYEFVPQQTGTTYLGNNKSFVGSRHTLNAINLPLSFAFQKNRELLYYRGTSPVDQVSLTLLPSNSLLPEPVFQLKHYQGENRPCSAGGSEFLKQKAEDELLLLREDLYLTTDEFDFESMTDQDSDTPFNMLDELKKTNNVEDVAEMLSSMPEEDALALLGQLMAEFNSKMEQNYTLAQCLSMLDMADLEALLRYSRIAEPHPTERTGLESALFTKFTDSEFLSEQFRTLTIPEIELLDALCLHNLPFDGIETSLHAVYPLQHGLCYLDETGHYLTVPTELRPLYRQLIQDESFMMDVQFYDMLHTFCYTAVYLYGAYPIRHLLRKINETMQMVIPLSDLEKTVGPVQHDRKDYVLRDGWIIAAELAQDNPENQNALEQLKALQNQRTDFFWPDMEQLESLIFTRRLADEELYDDFADAFQKYLNDGFNFYQALVNIEYWMRSNVPFEIVAGQITGHLFTLPSSELEDDLLTLLQEIYNKTPMWSLGGYTPEQMTKKRAKKAPSTGGKIVSLQEHRNKKNQ